MERETSVPGSARTVSFVRETPVGDARRLVRASRVRRYASREVAVLRKEQEGARPYTYVELLAAGSVAHLARVESFEVDARNALVLAYVEAFLSEVDTLPEGQREVVDMLLRDGWVGTLSDALDAARRV